MRPLRTRGPTTAHQEAVSRRLAQLDAELAAVRAGPLPTGTLPAGPRERPEDRGWDEEWDDDWHVAPAAAEPPPWEPLPPAGVPDSHTRIRRTPNADGSLVVGDVPQPGRHASRRSGAAPSPVAPAAGSRTGWAALVPETLHGRAGLGAAQLAVVAVLVSVGLAVTCWWVLRSGPEPLPASAPVGALVTPAAGAPGVTSPPAPSGDAAGGAAAPSSPASAAAEVVVDVAGKVRRPGIAVLPGGSRVADALEAAGGVRPGVDLTSLNLARVLVDGEQILVGATAPPGGAALPTTPAAPGVPGTPAAPGALVNVNTADLALLDTLPGVGPVTAQAILDWRTENGGFSAVEDLLDVSGIGEVTLAELTPLVTV